MVGAGFTVYSQRIWLKSSGPPEPPTPHPLDRLVWDNPQSSGGTYKSTCRPLVLNEKDLPSHHQAASGSTGDKVREGQPVPLEVLLKARKAEVLS